jgi:hypothetical protein
MEHIAPLIQTVLWVALIGSIMFRFHKNIGNLLDALQRRIEEGSIVKAGPFEIGAGLRTAPLEDQRQRLEQEFSQVVASRAQNSQTAITSSPKENTQLRSRILNAEDLALRAIQDEFGVPMARQIGLQGSGLLFDGMFSRLGTGYLVEVKYCPRPPEVAFLKMQVDRILRQISPEKHRYWRLLFAFVFDDPKLNIAAEQRRITEGLKSVSDSVQVFCYDLNVLEERFGITSSVAK